MKQVSSTEEKVKNKIEHPPPIKVTIKKEVISPVSFYLCLLYVIVNEGGFP